MQDLRRDAIVAWLQTLPSELSIDHKSLCIASADASFRRYLRVYTSAPAKSYIVMDAPPEHEDTQPFVSVSHLLENGGLAVPTVIASESSKGFLLLDDLGDTLYLSVLNEQTAPALYADAIRAIIQMQKNVPARTLPLYDSALLQRELMLYPDWYIKHHRQKTLTTKQESALQDAFQKLVANVLSQPTAFVHRDFHSRNLMLVAKNNPGIIDFQDAVQGPLTYDLVSLLKDAYISWPEAQVLDWTIRYWEQGRAAGLPLPKAFGEFYKDFEWMGLQRHIKILGIFARLNYRDGKARYLADMPLVFEYAIKVCRRYSELFALRDLLLEIEGNSIQVGYTF
jgi:N-acetylmuramate 1-kinase